MKHCYKSRFVFTVGDVVYVNQRWFPPLSCRCVQYSRHCRYLRIFLIRGFSGIISFTLQFNLKIYKKASCYLGKVLHGEMLYGEMLLSQ